MRAVRKTVGPVLFIWGVFQNGGVMGLFWGVAWAVGLVRRGWRGEVGAVRLARRGWRGEAGAVSGLLGLRGSVLRSQGTWGQE